MIISLANTLSNFNLLSRDTKTSIAILIAIEEPFMADQASMSSSDSYQKKALSLPIAVKWRIARNDRFLLRKASSRVNNNNT